MKSLIEIHPRYRAGEHIQVPHCVDNNGSQFKIMNYASQLGTDRSSSGVCMQTITHIFRLCTSLPFSLLVLSLLILCTEKSFARTEDFSKPIDVNADRSEFDEKLGVQSLIGNVLITQGSMRISADKITITLENNKLSIIKGEGSPIKFSQENDTGELIEGECRNITYDAANGRLTLIGNATLTEPKQRLRSEKIVFDSLTQTVVAEGGRSGQVKITIQPPEQK